MSEPTPPTAEEAQRFAVLGDAARDLASGLASGDEDALAASMAAFDQVASSVDLDRMREALHLPADAGVWAPELERMLRRIPDGWGRWISCGRGWYPILARLEQQISALAPDWELHQVKEKYGTLRFYAQWGERPQDPLDPEPAYPGRGASEQAREAWRRAHEAWNARAELWEKTPAGQAAIAAARELNERIEELIGRAENATERTCEDCGEAGSLRYTRAPSPWLRTMCRSCAGDEYLPREEWEAWWAEEKPCHRARMRQMLIEHVAGARVLVASSDPGIEAAVEADYARDPGQVRAALENNDYGELWLGPGEAGEAAVTWIAERYVDHDPATGPPLPHGGRVLRPPLGAPRLRIWWEHERNLDTRPLSRLGFAAHYLHAAGFVEGRSPVSD